MQECPEDEAGLLALPGIPRLSVGWPMKHQQIVYAAVPCVAKGIMTHGMSFYHAGRLASFFVQPRLDDQ